MHPRGGGLLERVCIGIKEAAMNWDRIKKQAKLQMIASGDLKPKEDARPLESLEDMYDEYNHELFDGVLPTDLPVHWNAKLRRSFGRAAMTSTGRGKQRGTRTGVKLVRIEIKPGLTARRTRKTLVHEMCHMWAAPTHGEVGHGPHFWQKMKKCGYPKGHFFANAKARETDKWAG